MFKNLSRSGNTIAFDSAFDHEDAYWGAQRLLAKAGMSGGGYKITMDGLLMSISFPDYMQSEADKFYRFMTRMEEEIKEREGTDGKP